MAAILLYYIDISNTAPKVPLCFATYNYITHVCFHLARIDFSKLELCHYIIHSLDSQLANK